MKFHGQPSASRRLGSLLGAVLLAASQVHAEAPSQIGTVSSAVVSGRYFSCALDTQGAVQCWGNNDHGQLGAAEPAQSATPLNVGLASAAVTIAAGRSHVCALSADGSVACWGANDQGQLGDGSTTDRSAPQPVVGLATHIAALVAGDRHTCAIDTAGAIFCWGSNDNSQLGSAAGANAAQPVRVTGIDRSTALAAGGRHTCAVTISGGAFCWGDNASGQLGTGAILSSGVPQAVAGPGEPLVALTAGDAHTCALGASGVAYCWGHNGNGQIGDGSLSDASTPVAVTFGNLGGARVVSLAAGFAHTCAVLGNDEIDCWGDNNDGELGNGSTVEQRWPTPVASASLVAGANVSAGYSHTCAKTPTGGVLCWGSNGYGELARAGAASNRPVAVGGHASGVLAIAASYQHFCTIAGDGGVLCWGKNSFGELGNGTLHTGAKAPQAVVGLSGPALHVAAGALHTCAAMVDGTVQCWGSNEQGQLGDSTLVSRGTPATVVGLTAAATRVATGDESSCALMANGQVMCWGANDSGQLGDGDTKDSLTAVAVTGLSAPALALVAGAKHACALLSDQSVACWGDNSYSQLNGGTGPSRTTATPVVGIGAPVRASASALAAGQVATCAVLVDGSVQCWGFDQDLGTLGQGAPANVSLPPVTVSGVSDAVSVFAGQYHMCAVRSDGSVMCWGQGVGGQLGTGQQMNTGTAGNVVGLDSGVVALAGSYSNTCAVRDSGGLYCWGTRDNGLLGLGGDGVPGVLTTPSSVLLGQRIAFDVPAALVVGDAPATLGASASSGLTVSFDTWTPNTCTVVGNTVVALAPALCGIRASQTGNGVFAPAPQAYALVPVSGVPQFTLAKAADNAAPLLGQTLTYSIRVTNAGSDAGSADLHDDLPATVGIFDAAQASCSTSGDGAACTYAVQCDTSCHLSASVSLPASGSALLTLPVKALALGDASNTVSLTATSPVCQTRDCGDASASTGPIAIAAAPHFTQDKTIDATAHIVGDTVTYVIHIANSGDADGSADWQDGLSAALAFVSLECTTTGADSHCYAGSAAQTLTGSVALPPGGTATLTLTARVDAVGDITNAVTVTPTTPGCDLPPPIGSGNCGGGTASTSAATAYGASLSLQAAFGALGRLAPQDQFLLTIAGNGTDQVQTSGAGSAVATRAALVRADAGAAFTLSEAMAAGSNSTLDRYAPQLACSNALSPADGGTDPSTLQLNAFVTLRSGDRIACVVHNGGAGASLMLHQRVTPATDPGRFVLSVNSASSAALGDGGAFGPLALDAGNYTVGVAGAAGTVVSQYDLSYACVDAVSGASVSSGSGAPPAVALGAGQHLDCTVSATFAHSRLVGALGGGRQYAQFGHVVTYLVEIANTGGVVANAAHVAAPMPSAFDPAATSFACIATAPASCTSQGLGALSDTPNIPPGGRVSYVVSAGLRSTPSTDQVHLAIGFGAASDLGPAQNLSADTQLVIFRDSFQLGGDGSQWDPSVAGQTRLALTADGASIDLSPALRALTHGAVVDVARVVAGDVSAARVQAVRLDETLLLRLLTVADDGSERASDWLRLAAHNPIALLGRADNVLLLSGGAGEEVEAPSPATHAVFEVQLGF